MDTEKITHVLIVANWRKKESHEMSETIARYLGERGIRSTVFKTMTANEKIHIEEGTACDLPRGDGTVLYRARYLHSYGILIPPQWGTFGFVTEISVDEWQEAIDLFLEGKHAISRRLMIRTTVIRDNTRVYSAHALNEMVVASSGISKLINMALKVDDKEAGFFRSDGIIIATPPIDYSLAAGGPILTWASAWSSPRSVLHFPTVRWWSTGSRGPSPSPVSAPA